MKKLIVALGLVLSLGGVSALQAQMRLYNANLVKFGNVNTSPTLSSGLEIAMPNFLFKGNSVKFTVNGSSLELKGKDALVNAASTANPNFEITPIDPPLLSAGLTILGAKNDVAIGTTAYPLHSVYTTNIYRKSEQTLSDRRYKTNVKDLGSASEKIMRLRPVKFDYLEEKDDLSTLDSAHMDNIGLIAQELLEIVPEAVQHLLPEDIYTIDYTMLIPVLIKAMQEQQVLIEEQQMQIEDLQALVTGDNATSSPTFNSVKPKGEPAETVKAEGNRLWSNVPNPFKRETRIRYALTDGVREARLCIYDLSGKQLSCHRLNDRGESEFTLRAASLQPGIYLYSLIADGNVVDTHRMVVTE
mgnify:CR=1 FL=1